MYYKPKFLKKRMSLVVLQKIQAFTDQLNNSLTLTKSL